MRSPSSSPGSSVTSGKSKCGSATVSRSTWKLETGAIEETITVTGESPLLETASGSAGQVIDEKRISMLPLSDGNPFVLSRFVPGVAYTGDLTFSRPFDNGQSAARHSAGGQDRLLMSFVEPSSEHLERRTTILL